MATSDNSSVFGCPSTATFGEGGSGNGGAVKQAVIVSWLPPLLGNQRATKMMKDQGCGAGYAYAHDAPDGFSGQNYFPDDVKRPVLYAPPERGFERELKKRVEYFPKLRAQRQT